MSISLELSACAAISEWLTVSNVSPTIWTAGLVGEQVERDADRAVERVLDRHDRSLQISLAQRHRPCRRCLHAGPVDGLRAAPESSASSLKVPSGPR